jgi:hypothetical protein
VVEVAAPVSVPVPNVSVPPPSSMVTSPSRSSPQAAIPIAEPVPKAAAMASVAVFLNMGVRVA